MIFVTVGTHEQAFDRLIREIDTLKERNIITEEVYCQIGYCEYIPKFCSWKRLIPYNEMIENVKKARITISHGGPASFLLPLQFGKIPIVVPRKVDFNEHVNNHQLEFSKTVSERMKNIIMIENIEVLGDTIVKYDDLVSNMDASDVKNNRNFCEKFDEIVSWIAE